MVVAIIARQQERAAHAVSELRNCRGFERGLTARRRYGRQVDYRMRIGKDVTGRYRRGNARPESRQAKIASFHGYPPILSTSA